MGNSNSNPHATKTIRKSWTWKNGDEAVVKLMLPVYYTSVGMTATEVALAKRSWDHIASDSSPAYLNKLISTSFVKAYPTCQDWFLEVFYDRLFDIHPLCKPMFKSAMSKGSFIHGLLSFLFTALENKKAFHAKLLQIASSHCTKGVKAVEYGIIGECMFWTLDHCLGKDVYTDAVHQVWVKIFSSMLRVIVPVAVAHELASNEAQKNRVMDHKTAFGYKPSDQSVKDAAALVCPVLSTKPVDSSLPIIKSSKSRVPEGTTSNPADTTNTTANGNGENDPIEASEPPTAEELASRVRTMSVKQFGEAYHSRKQVMDQEHPYQFN